jgi:hypothetical protein
VKWKGDSMSKLKTAIDGMLDQVPNIMASSGEGRLAALAAIGAVRVGVQHKRENNRLLKFVGVDSTAGEYAEQTLRSELDQPPV